MLIMLSSNSITYAEVEKVFYAKATTSGTCFCETPSENSVLFEIPTSYFVQVEYVVDDYYKVSYDGLQGYVKKDKVSLMNGTPTTPYAQATFKLFVPYSLYQSPSQTSLEICKLSTDMTIKYYGAKAGQQLTSKSNIWYYSSITDGENIFYGYVFSGTTDHLSNIPTNNESFEIVNEDALNSTTSEFTALSTGTKIILIIAISIPSLLILYFLIKPSRIMQMNKKKSTDKQPRKIRHKDYFEYDENDL